MPMGHLITLTQMKSSVKVVIFNNGVLGFVAMEMKASRLHRAGVLDLQNRISPRWRAPWGLRCGWVSGELSNAIRDVLAHDGRPSSMSYRDAGMVDPPTITAEQIKGFSLWVRAGPGDAVIDVAKTNSAVAVIRTGYSSTRRGVC